MVWYQLHYSSQYISSHDFIDLALLNDNVEIDKVADDLMNDKHTGV